MGDRVMTAHLRNEGARTGEPSLVPLAVVENRHADRELRISGETDEAFVGAPIRMVGAADLSVAFDREIAESGEGGNDERAVRIPAI